MTYKVLRDGKSSPQLQVIETKNFKNKKPNSKSLTAFQDQEIYDESPPQTHRKGYSNRPTNNKGDGGGGGGGKKYTVAPDNCNMFIFLIFT